VRRWLLVLLLVLAAGCAAQTALVEGRKLLMQGRTEEGIGRLEQGVKANPGDAGLRNYYVRSRDLYVNQLLYEAEKARLLGRGDEALGLLGRALTLSPGNARVQAGLEAARAEQSQRAALAQARALFEGGQAGLNAAVIDVAADLHGVRTVDEQDVVRFEL